MTAKFSSYLILLVSLIACSSSRPSNNSYHKWEKLGERTVNYGIDKDEIKVTAAEGRFTAIKLAVKKAPLNMHRCVVHFRNGDKQNVSLKSNFSRNSETRVIDLNGDRRIISKVVIWYDTKNNARKKASVQLWGKH